MLFGGWISLCFGVVCRFTLLIWCFRLPWFYCYKLSVGRWGVGCVCLLYLVCAVGGRGFVVCCALVLMLLL